MRHALQPQDYLSLDPVPSPAPGLNRRQFAFAATRAGAAALAFPGVASSAQSTHFALGSRPDDLSVEDWNEVQARYQNLLRVYGNRLSPQQRHTLAHVLITNAYMLRSIRSFMVQNGDPSALTLRLISPSEGS